MHAWSSVVAALPLTRHAAWAAADLAATHTAPGGSDLPIEGARTHAPTISMGVLPVFLRFGGSARARGARGGGRGRWPEVHRIPIISVPSFQMHSYTEKMGGTADRRRRLAHRLSGHARSNSFRR